jgi:scyllo-inositol 2-dehydrogenase (NADP+)
MIQTALVGFGLSGRYLQAPFFTTNPAFRLKTVVTQRGNPAAFFPGTGRAETLDAVLADPEIDLVSIATPNETHFEYTRRALEAGKNVLVEKPMTATAPEAEALLALAQKTGCHLFVFQNRRFDSDFMTVQQVLQQGILGDVLRFEARFDRFKPVLNPKKWKETPGRASGILYDLGAHLIDQSIALFGPPKGVWGQTAVQREGSDVDDAFDVIMDYGRLKVHLSSSLIVRENTPRYVLRGTKGTFVKYGIDPQEDHLKAGMLPGEVGFGEETDDCRGTFYTEKDGVAVQEKCPTLRGDWGILFQNMADVMAGRAQPLVPLADVQEQVRIMEQITLRNHHGIRAHS